jgi:RNA 3'-terminal phosphate cyclase (ATP)
MSIIYIKATKPMETKTNPSTLKSTCAKRRKQSNKNHVDYDETDLCDNAPITSNDNYIVNSSQQQSTLLNDKSTETNLFSTTQQQQIDDVSSIKCNNEVICIDGSKGEGGGQIIRNAITYAVILQKELIIINIRSKRSKPGLQAQHVTCIQLATSIHPGGTIIGNTIQSSQIHYIPPPPTTTKTTIAQTKQKRTLTEAKHNMSIDQETMNDVVAKNNVPITTGTATTRYIKGDTGTAGSICLLLQVAIPCSIFNPSNTPIQLDLKGGTNASMAPQYDYWHHVFWPTIQNHCLGPIKTSEREDSNSSISNSYVRAKVLQRGFFPKGGGHVQVILNPLVVCPSMMKSLQPINLMERGDVRTIYIRAYHAGNLPRHIAQAMAKQAKTFLQKNFQSTKTSGTRSEIDYVLDIITETHAIGSSFGILVVATTNTGCIFGGSSLSSPYKKQRAEDIATDACHELWTTLEANCCVDEWLQDQLILFMTLASGQSTIITGSLSLHTQTAISIAEQITTVKFTITKLMDDVTTTSTDTNTNKIHRVKTNRINSNEPKKILGNSKCYDCDNYGQHGSVPGRHMIQCDGIGLSLR